MKLPGGVPVCFILHLVLFGFSACLPAEIGVFLSQNGEVRLCSGQRSLVIRPLPPKTAARESAEENSVPPGHVSLVTLQSVSGRVRVSVEHSVEDKVVIFFESLDAGAVEIAASGADSPKAGRVSGFFPNDVMTLRWAEGKRILGTSAPMSPAGDEMRITIEKRGPLVYFIDKPATEKEPPPLVISVNSHATAVNEGERFELDAIIAPFTSSARQARVMAEELFSGEVIKRLPMFFSATEGRWMLRYTPKTPGRRSFRVTAVTRNGVQKSSEIQLDVMKLGGRLSSTRFSGVSGKIPRSFVLDDGTTWFPVAVNLAWASGNRRGMIESYRRWFAACRRNRINLARVWLATWFLTPEKSDGRPDEQSLETLEEIFNAAGENGIRILLVLDNYYDVVNHRNRHPFFTALSKNRRPLSIDDYFNDPILINAYKRRCRELAARFACRPELFGWELFNEINLAVEPGTVLKPGSVGETMRELWVREMAGYLHELDYTGRPVTVSVSGPGVMRGLFDLEDIDFVQVHRYLPPENLARSPADLDEFLALANCARDWLHSRKPVMVGEFGLQEPGSVFTKGERDPAGVHMRHYLWASAFMPFAGPAMPWWWDGYIAPNDLFDTWRPLVELRGKLPHDGKTVWLNNIPRRSHDYSEVPPVFVTALKNGSTAAGYLRDSLAGWPNFAGESAGRGQKREIQGARVRLGAFPTGAYRISFIRPADGKTLSSYSFQHGGGELSAAVPPFVDDIGFFVEKKLEHGVLTK